MILAAGLSVWGVPTGIPDDLYEASRATAVHVLEFARDVPQGDDGFARLLEVAFAYAEDNSHGTDAVLPNRAAILALGVILGEDRVARVGGRSIPAGKKNAPPCVNASGSTDAPTCPSTSGSARRSRSSRTRSVL